MCVPVCVSVDYNNKQNSNITGQHEKSHIYLHQKIIAITISDAFKEYFSNSKVVFHWPGQKLKKANSRGTKRVCEEVGGLVMKW